MELVAKLTRDSIENLKHDITKRFFSASIPVDDVSFAQNENDSATVDITGHIRFTVVHYSTLLRLAAEFNPRDIDIGHTVVNNQMTLTLIMHDVRWDNLNIETKFVL